MDRAPANAAPGTLRELAAVFLRLGATCFGGPAVHIAVMEDELVRRRGWLSRQEFLDLLGAAQLIPGPNSTELAIHIGRVRAGFAGLVVAGASFILPAALIVLAIAWAYARYHALPEVDAILAGVKPVVLAVVAQALWNLSRIAVKGRALLVIGLLATAANALGLNELLVLLFAGAAAVAVRERDVRASWALPLAGKGAVAVTGGGLFLTFLKIGAVLFGSGYVLLAFLRQDLVVHGHWLTEAQLLDAIAVGQVTPGPVFTTATFIGYLLRGVPGAVLATLGIFLPGFVFVALSGPLIPRLRKSKTAGAFLDGVNVGSLALMAVVLVQLTRGAVHGPWTLGLGVASALLLLRFRLNATWLVLAGGVIGWGTAALHLALR